MADMYDRTSTDTQAQAQMSVSTPSVTAVRKRASSTGNNGIGTDAIKKANDVNLANSASFRKSEIDRTNKVIQERVRMGMDTSLQQVYLDKIMGYEKANAPARQLAVPSMTPQVNRDRLNRQDYVNNVKTLAEINAKTGYQSAINALKNKLANIRLSNEIARANTINEYNTLKQQTDQQQYSDVKNVKEILARRGLLNSGIDVSNQNDTGLRYAGIRSQQGIQKAQSLQELDNNNTIAMNDYETNAYNAQLERDKLINTAGLSAELDYATKLGIPYEQLDMQSQQNAFTNSMAVQQFNEQLNQNKFNQDMETKKFNQTVNMNEFEKWAQTQNIDLTKARDEVNKNMQERGMTENEAMGAFTRKINAEKWAQEYIMNNHTMSMQDKELKLKQDQFEYEKTFNKEKLALERSAQSIQAAYQNGMLENARKQTNMEWNKYIGTMGLQQQEFYATVSNDVWTKINLACKEGKPELINAIIGSSQLPLEMKGDLAENLFNSTLKLGKDGNKEVSGSDYVYDGSAWDSSKYQKK